MPAPSCTCPTCGRAHTPLHVQLGGASYGPRTVCDRCIARAIAAARQEDPRAGLGPLEPRLSGT